MILITGGAYQGKTEYAKKEFGLTDEDIYCCSDQIASIDTEKKAAVHLERFVLACIEGGISPEEAIDQYAGDLANKVVICDDISSGIVPLDDTERALREETGRVLVKLAKRADRVIRVFCGLAEEMKG